MTPAKEPGFMALHGAPFDLQRRYAGEPSYFVTTFAEYRALFRHCRDERIRGEATPHYLHHPIAPLRIEHYCPDAHIVVILRSPAARAYSAFMMGVRDGREDRSFDQAVIAAIVGPRLPPMLAASRYAEALRRYLDRFGRERVLVLLTEELDVSANRVLRRLFAFLDVDSTFRPDTSTRPNCSGVPRFRLACRLVNASLDHRLMKQLHQRGPKGLGQWLEQQRNCYYQRRLARKPLPPEQERFYNRVIFRDDIDQVQALIGHDLSHWIA